MTDNTNTYVLMNDRKNPSWQLRHNNVLVNFEDKKLKTIRKRKIRYSKGHHTFWDDELPKDAKTTSIDLVNGKFVAEKSDTVLNKYLQIHPEFNINYKLLDPEADALAELEIEEKVEDAILELRKMNEDQLAAVAITLFGDRATRNLKPAMIKTRLREYIKNTEIKTDNGEINAEYFLEVIKSPMTQIMFFVSQALRLNIIDVSPHKNAVRWVKNKGVIVPVASGQDPVVTLAEFLLEKENRATFEELKKEVG